MSEFGIAPKSLASLRAILESEAKVERAILYGSRAKGSYRPGSDIDLTLEGPGLSFTELARLATQFDESEIPYTIDLSVRDHITDPALREHIARVGLVLFQRARETG